MGEQASRLRLSDRLVLELLETHFCIGSDRLARASRDWRASLQRLRAAGVPVTLRSRRSATGIEIYSIKPENARHGQRTNDVD